MKKKRIVAKMALFCMLIGSFTGCGEKGEALMDGSYSNGHTMSGGADGRSESKLSGSASAEEPMRVAAGDAGGTEGADTMIGGSVPMEADGMADMPESESMATASEEGISEDIAADYPELPPEDVVEPQAGLLTAGEWRDNENWGFFVNLVRTGRFQFRTFGISPYERVVVQALTNGKPIGQVEVKLNTASGETIATAVTNHEGKAYLYYNVFGKGGEADYVVLIKPDGSEVRVNIDETQAEGVVPGQGQEQEPGQGNGEYPEDADGQMDDGRENADGQTDEGKEGVDRQADGGKENEEGRIDGGEENADEESKEGKENGDEQVDDGNGDADGETKEGEENNDGQMDEGKDDVDGESEEDKKDEDAQKPEGSENPDTQPLENPITSSAREAQNQQDAQQTENGDVLRSTELTVELGETMPSIRALDVMFVFDTTGSMGDELLYLQKEFEDIANRVADQSTRFSVSFYRDHGDEYIVRSYPFSDDIKATASLINAEYANGGGDYEEAVDEALLDAVTGHIWKKEAVKLMFLILDAPPHDTEEVAENLKAALEEAAAQGIRIIPIAASGVNEKTEAFLRSIAMITGGTYTFLTDDSGIGNSHLEPTVGAYTVEALNDMIVRLIKEYYGE